MLLVQHYDVALAPDHLELLGACHMRDVRGTVARGVDQVTAAHVSGGRRSVKRAAPSVASLPATSIASTGAERINVTPLATGVLQRGNGDLKRIHKASGGTPQRARRLGTGPRL